MAGGKGKCNSRDSRAFQPEPALFPLEAGMGNCASPSCVIVKLLILLVDSLRGFSPSDIRGCYSPRAVDCALADRGFIGLFTRYFQGDPNPVASPACCRVQGSAKWEPIGPRRGPCDPDPISLGSRIGVLCPRQPIGKRLMEVWQFDPRSSEQPCLLSVEQDLSCHAIAIQFAGGCGDGH